MLVAVKIVTGVWQARGALFGLVAAVTFVPVVLPGLFPSLERVWTVLPAWPLFAGLGFVMAGWWFGLPVLICVLVAAVAAAGLTLLPGGSRR